MAQVADQLSKVVQKTTRLIDLCAALQEENDLLNLENQSLRVAVDASKTKVSDLEEKLNASKLARSLESMAGVENQANEKTLDIKQKISEFVREIDKCIVLLKK